MLLLQAMIGFGILLLLFLAFAMLVGIPMVAYLLLRIKAVDERMARYNWPQRILFFLPIVAAACAIVALACLVVIMLIDLLVDFSIT
jgi:hypothetical protein